MENRQSRNYIEILKDSLNKKEYVLRRILSKNEEQRILLNADRFDDERFDALYEEKGKYISELELLDSGFESVYQRVSEELAKNKDMYAEDIKAMQNSIRSITSLSMEIESSEKRNKELMDKSAFSMKSEVKTARATNQAAVNYYHSMNRMNVIDPQFMDKKK